MAHPNPVRLFDAGEPVKNPIDKHSRANDLTGKEWTRNSISVWNDLRKTPEEAKLGHPAMFPGALVERLLLSFTKDSEKTVLDPFCGSGATLVTAKRMGKRGIGFEVAKEYYELSVRRLRQTQSRLFVSGEGPEAQVYHADAHDLPKYLRDESVDICITSPPYWDILSRKRSADYKAIKAYPEGDADALRIAS